jgi:hypothetical protein
MNAYVKSGTGVKRKFEPSLPMVFPRMCESDRPVQYMETRCNTSGCKNKITWPVLGTCTVCYHRELAKGRATRFSN